MIRKAFAAGKFYSENKDKLNSDLEKIFSKIIENNGLSYAIGVISPHAGYIYSGEVAANAISRLDPLKKYDNVFIIGTSHTYSFNEASVYNGKYYETPLGKVKINDGLCNELVSNSNVFKFYESVHENEHSIEVQLPFLQYWIKTELNVVPIIIGSNESSISEEIAGILKPYFNSKNAFVISTDFSHYPKYEDAVRVDNETADIICSGDPLSMIHIANKYELPKIKGLATIACGLSSVLTLMNLVDIDKCNYNKICYKNSGDSDLGQLDGVVGYWAISVTEKDGSVFILNDSEKKVLLKLARDSVNFMVENGVRPNISSLNFSGNLLQPCGAFVSIYNNSALRGCVGCFDPGISLFQVIVDMAYSAAKDDYRFPSVKKNEIDDLEFEISVLTPLKKIENVNEIVLGKHGIYIKKGEKGGTFLPQVATNMRWSVEEFLGYCARDKAGLSYLGWKEADVYIYEAIVFSDSDF